MSKRNKKWREEEEGGTLFTAEEEKRAAEIENTPIEDLPYEIIPTQGGGPASLQQDSLFKLIVIGDSGIGKSCLMHRMCHNEFTDDHEVTVGVEFGSILVKIKDIAFKLQIWDTAGQESFQSITKIFYRGAHGVLLTYDMTSLDSYMNLQHWFSEIKNQSEPDALIFLVANKKDKETEREVSTAKGESFAREKGLHGFFETSAKTGEGVEDTFISAAKMLFKMHYRSIREKQLKQKQPREKRVQIRSGNKSTASSGCKC